MERFSWFVLFAAFVVSRWDHDIFYIFLRPWKIGSGYDIISNGSIFLRTWHIRLYFCSLLENGDDFNFFHAMVIPRCWVLGGLHRSIPISRGEKTRSKNGIHSRIGQSAPTRKFRAEVSVIVCSDLRTGLCLWKATAVPTCDTPTFVIPSALCR